MLPPDRSSISTERRHPASEGLDRMSAREIVDLLIDDHRAIADAVARAAPEIAALVDELLERFARGGRLITLGAGTSGRLAVLDASECPPTFGSDPSRVVGLIAGGDVALRRAVEGAEDDPDGARSQFDDLALGPNDTVIGITAGGTTPYPIGALSIAKSRGAATALISCAPRDTPAHCDRLIVLDTGAEILTGSTRLKAGSATKLALNAITTALFVRLGAATGNLMTSLKPTNDKLVDRAIRNLMALEPGLDREEAARRVRGG